MVCGDDDELLQRAVERCGAKESHVDAVVVSTTAAVRAESALDAWLDGHALADPITNTLTDLDDDAAELVPEYEGLAYH